MHQDTMLSHLEANGVMWVPQDLFDIDRRIKWGDESGWRGDKSMGLFYNPHMARYEVWGIDRGGNQYLAASHHELSVELVHKLRDGDPTRNDPWQKVLDHNAKLEAERKAKDAERASEVADKLAWAIRRDFGQHLGGSRRQWHIGKAPKSAVSGKTPKEQ